MIEKRAVIDFDNTPAVKEIPTTEEMKKAFDKNNKENIKELEQDLAKELADLCKHKLSKTKVI